MEINISQKKLRQIVREEITRVMEKGGDEPPQKKPEPPKKDAKKDGPDGLEKKPAKGAAPPKKDAKPEKPPAKDGPAPKGKKAPGPNDVPADDDVIDLSVDDFEDGAPEVEEPGPEVSGETDGDEGDDDRSGGLNRELDGKTFQSLAVEPKSKLVPGAKEIVLSFGDTPDPLRIVVTQTGGVKFFFRGSLHDIP